MNAAAFAQVMTAAGFRVRLWRDTRIYVYGYGRDITACVEPVDAETLDRARIEVTTNWRSAHATLRCKGVKHALLSDLFEAGLMAAPPPDHWREVRIEERPRIKRVVSSTPSKDADVMSWPFGS